MDDASFASLRDQFPALSRRVGDRPAVFFDGPAGTQVPQRVIEAIADYLTRCNANHGGLFATSIESDQLLDEAHRAAADLVGSDDPGTIAFGGNMTSLTFALSRALSTTWNEGDEIILSGLEHDANYTPWMLAARDAGVRVHVIDVNTDQGTLKVDEYQSLLSDRTRLVAVGCASNAVGTINPVKEICRQAREAGAMSFLDAVHYAPHRLIDVADWGCDFLVCSAYKFFGPHVGIFYGRRELLESLQPYKLRPAPNDLPGRWMTGTQNHEGIAGTRAAIDYLAEIGRKAAAEASRREALEHAFNAITRFEQTLLKRLLAGLHEIDSIQVYGIQNPDSPHPRCPTLSLNHRDMKAKALAQKLADAGIFVWHGNYYALPLTERLGVEPDGMVRIGLVHYNTAEEVDRLLESLKQL